MERRRSSHSVTPAMDECLFGPSRRFGPNQDSRENDAAAADTKDDEEQPVLNHTIDLAMLRRLASQGIGSDNEDSDYEDNDDGKNDYDNPNDDDEEDDDPNDMQEPMGEHYNRRRHHIGRRRGRGCHRAVAWRVLLGYLPPNTQEWNTTLEEKRHIYHTLVDDLFATPPFIPSPPFQDHDQRRGSYSGNQYSTTTPRRSPPPLRRSPPPLNEEIINREWKSLDPLSSHDNIEIASDKPEGIEELTNTTNATMFPGQETCEEDSVVNMEHGSVMVGTTSQNVNDDDDNDKSLDMIMPQTPPDAIQKMTTISETTIMAALMISNQLNESSELHLENDETSKEDGIVKFDEILLDPPSHNNEDTSESNTSKNDGDKNDYAALVPPRIREEWKQSGRDVAALAGLSVVPGSNMNVLMVSSPRSNDGHDKDCNSPTTTTHTKWVQFLENASLLDEIRKDVVRTHPDLHFFLEPEQNLGQRRYAALERILFVWAKLNKGVRYVQGMNEIVGTIYYVLANDWNDDWAHEAEADTYFLFNALMVEMRDVFVPALDEADTGIQGRISNMTSLLSLHDPEVRCHLDDCGIDASFYAIRWVTTLLSREFLLPDTIRLWDSMFASTHKDNFLRYVCVTMVMMIREDLLKGDFSSCLRLLQSYPPTDVDFMLEASRALWIYESQVTLACHKGGISLHQALSTITPPPALIMAYGLPGGVAMSRSDRPPPPDSPMMTPTTPMTGRGFLQGAKGFLGGLGREVALGIRRSKSSDLE